MAKVDEKRPGQRKRKSISSVEQIREGVTEHTYELNLEELKKSQDWIIKLIYWAAKNKVTLKFNPMKE